MHRSGFRHQPHRLGTATHGAAWVVLALLMAKGPALALTPRRFGSGPLMRSIQNEADAAIARAQTWLLGEQAENGCWGGSAYLTAVCALAVSGDGGSMPPTIAGAVARALRWLESHPVADTNHLAFAWRSLALRVLGEENAVRETPPAFEQMAAAEPLVAYAWMENYRMLGAAMPSNALPAGAADPAEALVRAAQWQAPRAVVQAELRRVAREWEGTDVEVWRTTLAQRAWWLARTINRQAAGELNLTSNLNIDWRRDLADAWVNRQRITTRGGGHWVSDQVSDVEETAFAILLLREL